MIERRERERRERERFREILPERARERERERETSLDTESVLPCLPFSHLEIHIVICYELLGRPVYPRAFL